MLVAKSYDRKAYQFFRQYAGYVVGRNAEGALRLARAERWARDVGCEVEWEPDCEGCSHCDCCSAEDQQAAEVYGCVLRSPGGEVESSVWGVCNPDSNYRRVVEAELASEAMPAALQLVLFDVRERSLPEAA